MEKERDISLEPTAEQFLYARVLEKGMIVGLLSLFVTFIIYAFGIMNPYVPLNELSRYWTMNVHDYLQHANIEAGWAWVGMLSYGDFINFIGIVILAGVTIFCYLSIVPILFKNKDRIYAMLALLEAIILLVAASGIISVSH